MESITLIPVSLRVHRVQGKAFRALVGVLIIRSFDRFGNRLCRLPSRPLATYPRFGILGSGTGIRHFLPRVFRFGLVVIFWWFIHFY